MKVTAALVDAVNAPFALTELDLESPGEQEVQIRILASGVCASDAHSRSGRLAIPMPCVLGHEGAGVVEDIGSGVTHVRPGDHVALSWIPSCGSCRHCVTGRPSLCASAERHNAAGTMLDGTTRLSVGGEPVHHCSFISSFATHAVVPAASAIPINEDIPMPIAAIAGCAILTGFGAAVNRAKVTPGSSVLVFGAGGVGLSIVMAARLSGAAEIIVVDPVESKRAEAQVFGATTLLDPADGIVSIVQSLTHGDGVDFSFDAVGAGPILEQAFAATVVGGTIICVGVPGPNARPSLPGTQLVRQEKIVTGSLYGSSRPSIDIPRILDLYRSGFLPLDRMITQSYCLNDIGTAFADMDAGRLNRGVLLPQS